MCGKVPKCGKIPRRFCPFVVAFSFSLKIRGVRHKNWFIHIPLRPRNRKQRELAEACKSTNANFTCMCDPLGEGPVSFEMATDLIRNN